MQQSCECWEHGGRSSQRRSARGLPQEASFPPSEGPRSFSALPALASESIVLLTSAFCAQELEAKVRAQRDELKTLRGTYDKTEDDLKALQSVGQIIGEVLRQLDEERCA